LGEVESLAGRLGLILSVIVGAAAVYALAASARDRRPEHASLRALGVRPRTMAAMLGLQLLVGVTMVVAVGLPAGLAVGNNVWEPIARRSHLVVSTALPWNEMGQTAGLTLALAAGGVALLSRALFRARPEDLRQE
ncbi:MAG TPA: FtsX-like permease family protein, partial [Acidimicrobiia bacterium]|nr:FtsX-like permease family protein [Acidimicrobiia bacterium]